MYHVICTPHHGRESWVSSGHDTVAVAVDYAERGSYINRDICYYRVSPVDCPSVGEAIYELPQPLYELRAYHACRSRGTFKSAAMDMVPGPLTWQKGCKLFHAMMSNYAMMSNSHSIGYTLVRVP